MRGKRHLSTAVFDQILNLGVFILIYATWPSRDKSEVREHTHGLCLRAKFCSDGFTVALDGRKTPKYTALEHSVVRAT